MENEISKMKGIGFDINPNTGNWDHKYNDVWVSYDYFVGCVREGLFRTLYIDLIDQINNSPKKKKS